ncbi:MAG: hypothetical protein QNJ49_09095 [Mastigocoleus sp. MO_167.B18]|nr:hypothetical protein [Mastigocoleus sp. MO_167.B18]
MRNTSIWSKDLRKALRKSEELQEYVDRNEDCQSRENEIKRLARLITNIELGLTLLIDMTSQESANAVPALLSGYRFPVPSLQNEENWRKVQIARFYLIRLKGQLWERSLDEYICIPEELRIFDLENINSVPALGYTSICPHRLDNVYRPALNRAPPHLLRKVKAATEGRWFVKISAKGNSPEEIPIYIPKVVANLVSNDLEPFESTREAINPAYTVTKTELLQAAQEMDRSLKESRHSPQNYYQRLLGVDFKLYDSVSNDFQVGEKIHLDKLIHIVGLLNVGKSMLLQILIYLLAKKGWRCALVVDNVVSQVRLASLFWFGLGVPAAPILGSDRAGHLQKVYEPVLLDGGEEIYKGGKHPAWRWFSPVCPLLALVQSETIWEFGDEPCHQLYEKDFVAKEKNDRDIEIEEKEDEKLHTCPFYFQCPRHQLEKDIAQAKVWILTPASLIHSRVPRQVFDQNMRFAEAVYRECNFLFVDEADRVQVQFDEAFAPDEVLLDNSQSAFLNKLGLNLNPIYRSNRTSMTADLFESWTNAQYDAQKAINRICPILYQQEKLVNWLGDSPFRGYSLFARLIRELVNPNDTEDSNQKVKLTRTQRSKHRQQKILEGLSSPQQKKRQKELLESLENFLQAPLQPEKGGKLSNIALVLMSANNDNFVFGEIEKWWNNWLKAQKITKPDKENFEQIKRKTYFAILITVLENRLIYLVDNLSRINRLIDLHELRQWLVNRPPFDYLPIVPNSPVGNILGFKYTRIRPKNLGGKLEYFRYVGIGRYLLLNFPTLFAVDDIDGCHTILISGTSYAPGSPAYHIKEKPTILLEPASNNHKAGDAGIARSEFYFKPQQLNGKYIAISGLLPDRRKQADEEMVKAICYRRGNNTNLLNSIFEKIAQKAAKDESNWRDRSRILVINNSYDETERINNNLNKNCHTLCLNADAIKPLIRDNNPDNNGIPRGKLELVKDTHIKILSAPLMALERGHNILNNDKIAAFGTGIFINRPMPVPDDWQSTVRQLNAWTLDNVEKEEFYRNENTNTAGNNLTLSEASKILYGKAVNKIIDLNCRAMSYKQLDSQERSVLCWTQLISMWQVIGRLVRGGVPCLIYFLDIRFTDNFAKGKKDNETSSLLVGIIKELEELMESEIPYEKTLAQSLYGAFLQALKNTDQLDYEFLNYE